MKLKEFNTETCKSLSSDNTTPSVRINMITGLFRFNKGAARLMGLRDGDELVFQQDEEDPDNWYLERSGSNGFVIRDKEDTGKGFLFNNAKLAREIAASVAYNGKTGKCLIAGVPTKLGIRVLWGVLTGSLVNK